MSDPRHTTLAEQLIHSSCELKPGDKVLIEAIDIPHKFTNELVRVASLAEAVPFVTLKSQQVWRAMLFGSSEDQMRLIGEIEATSKSQPPDPDHAGLKVIQDRLLPS